MEVLYLSDNLISLNGPVDRATGAAVSSSPVSCTARIYDESKETRVAPFVTRLTEAVTGSSTTISVPTIRGGTYRIIQEVNETALVTFDDGVKRSSTLSATTELDGFDRVTASALNQAAAVGNAVEILTYPAGVKMIPVEDNTKIVSGDTVEIRMDSGAYWVQTVTEVANAVITEDATDIDASVRSTLMAINHDPISTIRSTDVSALAVTAGTRVRVKLGSDIAMTSFGSFPTSNPVEGDTAWGFRGTIPDTLSASPAGMRVRIEITYDGGAGLKHVTALLATLMEHSG